MSIHPSLKGADKNKKQRSVLKRIERLKLMTEKNEWKESDSVFGLPKIKTVRIKIKKEKTEKAETTATGAAPAAAAGTTAGKEQAGAKTPAGAKAPAAKGQDKK